MAFPDTPPDNSPLVSSSAGQSDQNKSAGGLRAMSPANFGMVMATGIVSIGAHMLGHPFISQSLFVLNNGLFLLLCALTVLRALRYPRDFFADMVDHLRGPGFFTTVAACAVLGSQYLVLRGDSHMGRWLWAMALTLWVVLTYTIFTALTIKRNKPSLDKGINGGWLLAVVATQSISVSSALLATKLGQPFRLELNFLALSMWLWGGMLYIWTMALIFYRYTFFRLSAGDLTPPYWINMGAMAISTLAGSLLIDNAPDAPYLQSVLPFLKGFTIFYWASGTWWIPMLLILGVWRYGYRRFPFEYDPLYWGAVFPLGMYAACTWQMDHVMGFGFLQQVPRLFFLMALLAWVCTAYGALASVYRLMRHKRFGQG